MAPGDRVVQLACHETHQFHEGCYNNFDSHFTQTNQAKLCPLCRTPVDAENIVKKQLHKAEPSQMKVEDAFGLADIPEKAPDTLMNAGSAQKLQAAELAEVQQPAD